MTPEFELLLSCARAQRDQSASVRIRALIERGLHWGGLLLAARRHRLIPLLAFHVSASSPDLTPAGSLAYLRDEFEWNARRNLYLTEELLGILTLFQANGVGAIPFKGPLLAIQAYRNVALRQFVDLDVLIAPTDLGVAKRLLASRGYRPDVDSIEDRVLVRCGYELALRRGDQFLVELQWGIGPPSFAVELPYERMRARLQPVSIGSRHAFALSIEDSLLTLCVHGAKHRWSQLGWICDVAELIRGNRIDWDAVLRESRSLGGERMLLLGLTLARDLLGAPLPPDVARMARTDRASHVLSAQVGEALAQPPRVKPGIREHAAFYLRTRERLTDQVRIVARLAILPTVDDWRACRLPPALAPLQFLLRPLRLFAKQAHRLSRAFALLSQTRDPSAVAERPAPW